MWHKGILWREFTDICFVHRGDGAAPVILQ